ncbi:MAG: hypothetical protein RR557_07785 [Bacilli bacterium]
MKENELIKVEGSVCKVKGILGLLLIVETDEGFRVVRKSDMKFCWS